MERLVWNKLAEVCTERTEFLTYPLRLKSVGSYSVESLLYEVEKVFSMIMGLVSVGWSFQVEGILAGSLLKNGNLDCFEGILAGSLLESEIVLMNPRGYLLDLCS